MVAVTATTALAAIVSAFTSITPFILFGIAVAATGAFGPALVLRSRQPFSPAWSVISCSLTPNSI